jgi:general secretion pathway protein G
MIHRNPKRSNRGFTLIELLVVFTLLALLLSIAVPRYLNVAEASRIKVQDQNMATIRDALDKFKADQGRYPSELEELVTKKYLRGIPLDPVSGTNQWMSVRETNGDYPGVMDVVPFKSDTSVPDSTTTQLGGKPANE